MYNNISVVQTVRCITTLIKLNYTLINSSKPCFETAQKYGLKFNSLKTLPCENITNKAVVLKRLYFAFC